MERLVTGQPYGEKTLILLYRSKDNVDIFGTFYDIIFKTNLEKTRKNLKKIMNKAQFNIEPELSNFFNFLILEFQKDFGMERDELFDSNGTFRFPKNHEKAKLIHSGYIEKKLNGFYRFKLENQRYKEDVFGYGNFDEFESFAS